MKISIDWYSRISFGIPIINRNYLLNIKIESSPRFHYIDKARKLEIFNRSPMPVAASWCQIRSYLDYIFAREFVYVSVADLILDIASESCKNVIKNLFW